MSIQKLPHCHCQNIDEILDKMPDPSNFTEAAVDFQLLGDGSRLRILWILCHSEQCVINIAAAVSMSTAAVSHHLKTLRMQGLITSQRAGKEVYYTLADTAKAKLLHSMIDDYFKMSCPGKGLADHCTD